jgi:phage terminase small subunit
MAVKRPKNLRDRPPQPTGGRGLAKDRGAATTLPGWADGLSDREYSFVEAYLANLRLFEAAVAAGYAKSCAQRVAWELIRKPHIREAVDQALAERFSSGKASIVDGLAKMAFFNPGNVLSWDAKGLKLKPSNKLTAADWAGIESVKMAKDGSVEVRFVDRLMALEKLAKVSGIMRELPESVDTPNVQFIIGDPEPVLQRYRAERARQIEQAREVDTVTVPGEHTDLEIRKP